MKKYSLTEEHKKQLKPWADIWIKNAMSTKKMDENEKDICRRSVKGLYEVKIVREYDHLKEEARSVID